MATPKELTVGSAVLSGASQIQQAIQGQSNPWLQGAALFASISRIAAKGGKFTPADGMALSRMAMQGYQLGVKSGVVTGSAAGLLSAPITIGGLSTTAGAAAGAALTVGLAAYQLAEGQGGEAVGTLASGAMSMATPVFGWMYAAGRLIHGFASTGKQKRLQQQARNTGEAVGVSRRLFGATMAGDLDQDVGAGVRAGDLLLSIASAAHRGDLKGLMARPEYGRTIDFLQKAGYRDTGMGLPNAIGPNNLQELVTDTGGKGAFQIKGPSGAEQYMRMLDQLSGSLEASGYKGTTPLISPEEAVLRTIGRGGPGWDTLPREDVLGPLGDRARAEGRSQATRDLVLEAYNDPANWAQGTISGVRDAQGRLGILPGSRGHLLQQSADLLGLPDRREEMAAKGADFDRFRAAGGLAVVPEAGNDETLGYKIWAERQKARGPTRPDDAANAP